MADKNSLSIVIAIIEGKCYNVEDFDRERAIVEGPKYLYRGRAYRIDTDMTKGLFPYRGEIRKGDKWSPHSTPGIYVKRSKRDPDKWLIKIAYPRGEKQREEYALGKDQDAVAAIVGHEWRPNSFYDLNVHLSNTTSDVFKPPIRMGDDVLNTLMKMGIRIKEAPFEPYGKRLESLAVDRSKGIEGINMRNNSRRGLLNNTAMSANKFVLYSDVWELEAAIILKDVEDSSNPMFEDGKMLVIYPNGAPFEIETDKLVDIAPMVRDAVLENSTENQNELLEEKEDKDD